MMDYYDSLNPSKELVLKFQDCVFRDNQYFGKEAYSALIFGNSDQNRLILVTTTFENNNMMWNKTNTKTERNGFLIQTLGPTCIDRTCFINNLVGVSDVAIFGNSLVSSQAHLSNSSGNLCRFASWFENVKQFRSFKPTCIAAEEERCNFDLSNDMATNPCDNHFTSTISTVVIGPSTASSPSKAPTTNLTAPTQTPVTVESSSTNIRGSSTIVPTDSTIFDDDPPSPSVHHYPPLDRRRHHQTDTGHG
mmetsp:Transcript_9742/g.20646  ORF Transcript_9742/g.20646 Transcript_9742/m.20646 type:complete len:249 (+) Transcript_9742:818-1564(+)